MGVDGNQTKIQETLIPKLPSLDFDLFHLRIFQGKLLRGSSAGVTYLHDLPPVQKFENTYRSTAQYLMEYYSTPTTIN